MDPGNLILSSFAECTQLTVVRCCDEETFTRRLRGLMPVYAGSAGCFLYLLSLVVTRGAQRVREDMDDLNTTCK